ncbi:MAG: aspartate aminotransferase family protein [Planctomycetota bacterium]
MPTYARHDDMFVAGKGAVLHTDDGREVLDFLCGIAVTALGHSHDKLTQALRDQVGKLTHVSNLLRHPLTESVATRLCKQTDMHAAFFCNSGAEAIECALKIARRKSERRPFLALQGGFHGRTFGALSLTHTERYRAPFAPLLDVDWIAANDIQALTAALQSRKYAALVLEPIQGEGGIRPLSALFLHAARKLCSATDTALVHDEIQSGCGRTGTFLAAQAHAIVPDIVTIAKPIAAGLPMGACLAREPFAQALQPGDHGTTFGGGPLVCRAASVFLDELGDVRAPHPETSSNLLDAVRQRGKQLRQGLDGLCHELPCALEVRGRGLMLGLRLDRPAAAAQQQLLAAGLLVNVTSGDVLRIVPPYVVTESQIDRGLFLLRKTLLALPPQRTKSHTAPAVHANSQTPRSEGHA